MECNIAVFLWNSVLQSNQTNWSSCIKDKDAKWLAHTRVERSQKRVKLTEVEERQNWKLFPRRTSLFNLSDWRTLTTPNSIFSVAISNDYLSLAFTKADNNFQLSNNSDVFQVKLIFVEIKDMSIEALDKYNKFTNNSLRSMTKKKIFSSIVLMTTTRWENFWECNLELINQIKVEHNEQIIFFKCFNNKKCNSFRVW